MIPFSEVTRRGSAHGIYNEEDKSIYIHFISGQKCMRGLMNILINKFHTRRIIFTPLINNNIEHKVRGRIKIISKDDSKNPYKEDIRILICCWND